MQLEPVDLTEIVAVVLGISIVLVPVFGLTVRFALKPAVEALQGFFRTRDVEESVRILERRMALLEQQMEGMESSVRHLSAISEYDARIEKGSDSG